MSQRTQPNRGYAALRLAGSLIAFVVLVMLFGATPAMAFDPGQGTDPTLRPQGVDATGRPLRPDGRSTLVGPGTPITRTEIIDRARSWVNVPYSQDDYRDGYRTDCSGYISMAWRTNGNFWTGNLATIGVRIGFNELSSGDMLLYHNPSNPVNGSHVVLFDRWVSGIGGDFYMYEQTPPHTLHRKWSETSNRTLSNYLPYRYVNLADSGPPAPTYRQSPGYADVNGDGREDLVAQNSTDAWVALSDGTRFTAPVKWSSVAFFGQIANHIGDVNNDGRADLVAQNTTDTWVALSDGTRFAAPVKWSAVAFVGQVGNHIGDVNNDGRADLVAQNGTDTWVALSDGTRFAAPVKWSSVAFYGQNANHIGDVNNDGRADLVAQNTTDTWVALSDGTRFTAPVKWSAVAFFGQVANHIGDVNNDGRADLVAQNTTDAWVALSDGTSFAAPVKWSSVAFFGQVANHIGDVNNDGRADLVAQNTTDAWVALSDGTRFTTPAQWSAVAFYGQVTNHG